MRNFVHFLVVFLLYVVTRSMNAPVMVDIEGEIDPLKIAEKELREKKVPMVVRLQCASFLIF